MPLLYTTDECSNSLLLEFIKIKFILSTHVFYDKLIGYANKLKMP